MPTGRRCQWEEARVLLCREELTSKATDDSSDNEMSDVLGATLEGCSNNPDDTCNLKNSTTAHVITQPASGK